MASLFTLVNRTLTSIQNSKTIDDLRNSAIATIKDLIESIDQGKKKIIKHMIHLVQSGGTVATYSRSSLVIQGLLDIKKSGIDCNVALCESRPMNEGRRAAAELTQAGIAVTFWVDAAMSEMVKHCDCVIIGADSFSRTDLVNKIGSKALALLAQESSTPFYSICTTDKYMPETIVQPHEEDHETSEVWSDPPGLVEVKNIYFETVPLKWITQLITERGTFAHKIRSMDWMPQVDSWLNLNLQRLGH